MSSGCVRSSSLVSVGHRARQHSNTASIEEQPTFIMKLLEVVDLVLILVIAMVSWPGLSIHAMISMHS